MEGRRCLLLVLVCAALFPLSPTYSRTVERFVGSEIPKRLHVGSHFLFYQSDSLYLNSVRLEPDVDYRFDRVSGAFDLSRLTTGDADTLVVKYSKLPQWVQLSYGRLLPEVTPTVTARRPFVFPESRAPVQTKPSGFEISGAKTFRFSTMSVGGSQFGQSLDLSLSGMITGDVEISGSISDRGYNPTYGTSDSRLGELDKINLRLTSPNVRADMGDITLPGRLVPSSSASRRVSGAAIALGGRRWELNALVARPRGRFASLTIAGIDGRQGPYRLSSSGGRQAVVPGSETVYVDGVRIERGANQDYTIDYPTGEMTFNVTYPIDRRSRIEIDYEIQAAEYREELLATGAGGALEDSTFYAEVSWLRDGDDKDQPIGSDLSDFDRSILSSIGDNVNNALKSGIVSDSAGDYLLVVDSLPDSVFVWAGGGAGQFRLQFSFAGEGSGDYRFRGAGRYDYVGRGNGDYLPVARLPVPERTEYVRTRVGTRNRILSVDAELQQSSFDRNLLSDLGDSDNDGLYYTMTLHHDWKTTDQPNRISVRTRRREAEFRPLDRIYEAEFGRHYLIPEDLPLISDESFYEAVLSLRPAAAFGVTPFFSTLQYDNRFESNRGGAHFEVRPQHRVELSGTALSVRSTIDTSGVASDGRIDRLYGSLAFDAGAGWRFGGLAELDRRRHSYSGVEQGTRFGRGQLSVRNRSESVTFDLYVEDSLVVDWVEQLTRQRLSATSARRYGGLSYRANLAYQWLTKPQSSDQNLLVRIQGQYSNHQRQLSVSTAYTISEETRNSRAISYLEVEQGQGDFIQEDGRFLPDPDGNFIKVQEILSDKARVRRGTKNFDLTKDFGLFRVRFNSAIEEELLDGGKRSVAWLLPFYADDTQPYLFYQRQYDSDLRLFPVGGYHAVNLAYAEQLEIRRLTGLPARRHDRRYGLTLRQGYQSLFFEQSLELFNNDRDNHFAAAGEAEGYRASATGGRRIGGDEIAGTFGYRQAESNSGEESKLAFVVAKARLRMAATGQLRGSLELYSQSLSGVSGMPSYQLTENRNGARGIIWSMSLRRGIKEGMRLNLTLSGRHADNRTSRIVARGEVVVEF